MLSKVDIILDEPALQDRTFPLHEFLTSQVRKHRGDQFQFGFRSSTPGVLTEDSMAWSGWR